MDSRKITDPLNRGMVGGMLGMPADMLNMLRNGGRSVGNLANRLAGVNAPPAPMVENPVYGQEWWGNKMQQAGYVSPNRNKLAEFGAGLLDPGSVMTDVPMLAKGLFALGDPALQTITKGLLAKKAYDVAPDVWKASMKNLSAPATLNKPGFAGQRGAIVWHGSPHAFDAFDSSKIGIGEGAQAYGHGLYLAESPSVARSYLNAGDDALKSTSPTLRSMLTNAEKRFNWDEYEFEFGRGPLHVQQALLAVENKKPIPSSVPKNIADFVIESNSQRGNLYKVDIPDDAIAKMLDWDKPLSQQAPEVQAGVRKVLIDRGQSPSVADYIVQNKTGRDALSTIGRGSYDARLLPPDGEAAAQSSNWLKAQGIPGIRYLDGGSRGTGAGTSNFVVFPGNEGLLKILERNGKPLK